ncbi:MAG: S8 family serine peptidase [Candidatus Heimdallarchaeum aukensis]|uniref:S8 family serine peptidase n=1 Tax=Candidatus Heimdallarchaeum aukensis TaxID=2876573 RepID=A0A9Y1BJX5_9ARCH|nr:MAG: S8 family serine peptidase [Candidatus Heimdallarchaeum aukensis]
MFHKYFSKSLFVTFLALLVSFSLFNLPAKANFDSRITDIQDNFGSSSSISVDSFSSGADKEVYNKDKRKTDVYPSNFLSTSVLDKYQSSSLSKPQILSSSVLSELERTPKNRWQSQMVKLIVTFDPSYSDVKHTLSFSYGAEILDNIPVAFVTTSLDNVFSLSTLSGVKGLYLDQYYQFIDPSWKQLDESVLTYPSEAYIGARALLDLGITGSGIKIAIVDTGIDKYHSDLDDFDNDPSTNDPKVIAEMSFIDYDNDGINDTDAMDEFGHGTHCAGIAAANGSLQGVAPGAYLINARALDAFGGAYVSWVVNAIDWAVSQGADVISMSIGWMPGDIVQLLNDASDAAWESGSMVVVAAGNSGPSSGTISSPGMASRAITVGASDMFNGTTYWSSRGPSTNGLIDPDVIAPGAGILSTIPNNMYEVYSGTSMATPAVAGVVALLKSVFPSVDIDLIRSAILSTATDMGRSVFEQGAGMINALEAYNYLSNPQAFVFPSFTETSPLKLSPNEILTYQLDIFVEQVYNSLSLEPSAEILPYVSTSFIDSPDSSGWIRAALTVTMPDALTIGSIIVKNGSTSLYEVPLTLEPEEEANDANTSTDAGETLSGAISLNFGVSYPGELKSGDLQDFYKFSVIEGKNYSLVLTDLERDIDLLLTDENGTVIAYSINYGLDDEQIAFTALSSGDYYARVVAYDFGYYTIQVSEMDSLLSASKVLLTRNYDDFGFDSDSDGLYDNLTITVEVEVNEAGTYDFLYTICQNRDDYIFPKYYVASGWNTIYLEEGIQTIELAIDGGSIEQSNYDGDYILSELLIGDPTTWMVIEYLRDDYVTGTYSHTEFDPPEARLLSISYSQENLDGAGGPELFTIQCSFGIDLEEEVNVVFWLIDSQHLFGVYSETSIMGPLTTDVIFEFSGYNLLQILKGDIVVAGVVFSSENYLFFLPIYDTKSSADFSTYEPLYTFQITDKVVDYDSNGLYDTLMVDILIDSKVSTEVELYYNQLLYSLPAEKMVPSSGYGEYIQQTINEGKNHIYFEYSLTSAGARKLSGPYLIPIIVLTDFVYRTIFTVHHVSNQYDYNTFDTPTAYLSKFLGSENVISEFGGIKLTFEIMAKKELDVTISIDIESYYSLTGTYFYFWQVFEEHIYTGKNNISIIIPYQELFWYKFIGDLIVRQISIISWTSEDILYDQIIIHDVNYLDFSSLFDAYFEGTYDFEFIDDDADPLYEGVNFTFPIHINKAGNYKFTLFLSSGYSIPYSITISEYYEVGKHFVSFVVPASAIVRSASSNNRLGIFCSLQNTESGWDDEFTDTFEVKDINDFDYILPLTYYKIKSVSSFDNNSDGLFDGINIDLQLNASTTGTYYLSLYFSTSLLGESYFLDTIDIHTQFTINSPGLYDIDLTIYSYDLIGTSLSLSYFDSTEFELNLDVITIYDNLGEYTIIIDEKIPKAFDITNFDMSPPVEIIAVTVDLEDFTGDSVADYLIFTIDYVLSKPIPYIIFELNIEISYLDNGIEYYIFYNTELGFYPEVGEDSVEFRINLYHIFYDIPDEFEMSYVILVNNGDYEIITYYSSDRESFNTIIDTSTPTPTPTNTTPTEPTKNDFPMLISFAVIFILGVFFLKKKKR